MRTSRIAACAITFAASFVLFSVPPAEAYAPLTIGALDLSTPGHVKVRVTSTDAPYVRLGLGEQLVVKPVIDGGADFDLETWGYSDATLGAKACDSPDIWSCQATATQRSFTATQAVPTVIWDSDRFIEPYDSLEVTISDPQGGGSLVLRTEDAANPRDYSLGLDGTTLVRFLENYSGALRIYRCSRFGDNCVPISDTVDARVVEELTANVRWHARSVHPDDTPDPDNVAAFTLDYAPGILTGDVTISWRLYDIRGKFSYEGTAVPTLVDGEFELPLDLTPASDGSVALEVDIAVPTDAGTLTTNLHSSTEVDRVPPVVRGFSDFNQPRSIFPSRDDFRDDVHWRAYLYWPDKWGVEIRDSAGVLKRTIFARQEWAGWNGRLGGTIVPGAYQVTAFATDGVHRVELGTSIYRVYRHRLETRTFTRHIAAKRTIDRWTGRCSSIQSPSSHRWRGSLGLNSLTRCKTKTWKKSGVVVLHQLKLPRAIDYPLATLRVYGGPGRGKPRSLAYVEQWDAQAGKYRVPTRLGTRTRSYIARLLDFDRAVYGGRYLAWRTLTGFGARYDVKHYDWTVKYRVLRDPVTGHVMTTANLPARRLPGGGSGPTGTSLSTVAPPGMHTLR